jgi:hypothetical protein
MLALAGDWREQCARRRQSTNEPELADEITESAMAAREIGLLRMDRG